MDFQCLYIREKSLKQQIEIQLRIEKEKRLGNYGSKGMRRENL